MGCNHKRAQKELSGTWERKDKSVVPEDTYDIYRCPTCGAIRIDSHNIYCYSKGRFSKGDLAQKGNKHGSA